MLGVICQICVKRPATTHLTELGPGSGQVQELHLCATCIQQLGLKLEAGPPSIASVLDRKDDGQAEAGPPAAGATAAASEARCPVCGLTFGEFGSGKLFGCANDYTAFASQVEKLLRRYHGAVQHGGRQPGSHAPAPVDERQIRRTRLDAALREAVASEDYENAAKLRDELRRLDQTTG
jgi:protein arginine kinase activator